MAFLNVENITKSYARHKALNDVSLSIPEQSIYGLLGPNGAGKTSLIRIINQITGPDSGKIWFNNERLNPAHVEQIGYLPEERGLYKKMKIGEQALYLAQLKGMRRKEAGKALKEWFDKFDIMPWWNKRVDELSKGMAQKVQFITTVLHRPKLLILDEPFSGFDPINAKLIQSEIMQLQKEGTTIILSTHNMSSVEEICTHITLINNAKNVLSGAVKAIRDQYRTCTFEMEFNGSLTSFTNALGSGFQLISKHTHNEQHQIVRVKGPEPYKINDLLSAVLPFAEIISVKEVIPDMNDIFIKVVNNGITGPA